MADRTGQHLGNYRLVRLLGQGGFAEVYLGEHQHLGTQAAIKLLHTQLAGEDTDAFRKEAHIIARLVHPHIVRILDFGIEGETPFLVMDYAPNGNVRKRHPKGVALPLPTILGYVKQLADALQYAHDEHFIHRDVKPENMLVGRRQEILLSDFGIALLAQTSRSQSMQEVAGTASYMAPEQFQGKPRLASDQYALAVMVYEWLTGTCPFHGSFTEIASQHLFVPPPPLQGRTPAISPEVEQVVMTALAKDPKQRFGSVLAFATALEQASQIELAETIPAGRSSQLTELATAPDESLIPTELITPPSQPSIPTSLPTLSSQTAVPTELVTPPSQASLPPTELDSPVSQAASPLSKVSRHYWWMMALRGLLAVLFGLAAFASWAVLALLVLLYLFGAYALVDGVMAVVVSLQVRGYLGQRWVLLLAGIAGIAAGVVVFAWHAITLLALLHLIEAWAIVTGLFEITAAFLGRLPISYEWTLALAGIFSVLFGVILAFQPIIEVIFSLGWWIGSYAIVFGVLLLIRAFQFRTAGIG